MKVEKIFNNWTWPPDEGISFSYLIVLVMPIPNCENCSFGHSQKLPYMTRFACDLNQLASWVDTLWLLLEKRATVIKDMKFKSKMQPIQYIATALNYSVGSFGLLQNFHSFINETNLGFSGIKPIKYAGLVFEKLSLFPSP